MDSTVAVVVDVVIDDVVAAFLYGFAAVCSVLRDDSYVDGLPR